MGQSKTKNSRNDVEKVNWSPTAISVLRESMQLQERKKSPFKIILVLILAIIGFAIVAINFG